MCVSEAFVRGPAVISLFIVKAAAAAADRERSGRELDANDQGQRLTSGT